MVSDRPLVSVVVPNYNYARTLELCLRSIQEQTYQRLELILVDDGSTDDSVAVAERLGVRVLHTARNQGAGAARNLGVEHARGEILVFVDSDVALAPDAVEVAVSMLEEDPSVAVVCSIHDPEPLIRDSLFEEFRALQYYHWTVSAEGPVSFLFSAMCAMRRGVFDDIGPFKPWLRHNDEVDYGNRLTQRYTMVLTRRIRSRQDFDDRLVPLLRKLFRRASARVPLYAQRKRFARGFETSSRVGGSITALAAVVTAPLVLLGPIWAVVPALALALSVVADLGMYRLILRQRGPWFLIYSAAMYFLINVAIATGVVTGVVRWLCSDRFRRLYETDPRERRVMREARA
jgi:glycosyltransferase involved in cell wall biosynthesis